MGEVAPGKAGLGEVARARLPAGEGGGAPAGDGWLGGLGEVAPAQPRLGEVARARCAPEAEDTMGAKSMRNGKGIIVPNEGGICNSSGAGCLVAEFGQPCWTGGPGLKGISIRH